MITTDYLADQPQFIPEIASWYFREWGHLRPGDSVERRIERVTQAAGHRRIPTVMVASQEGRLLGSAMLVANDMDIRPELTPWLAGVFTAPKERRKGVAALLIQRVVEEARNAGFPKLYLYTFNAQDYYGRLGWKVHENTCYLGHEVTVMDFTLMP
jgi:GNAT superfamily N-acetyltransferase